MLLSMNESCLRWQNSNPAILYTVNIIYVYPLRSIITIIALKIKYDVSNGHNCDAPDESNDSFVFVYRLRFSPEL